MLSPCSAEPSSITKTRSMNPFFRRSLCRASYYRPTMIFVVLLPISKAWRVPQSKRVVKSVAIKVHCLRINSTTYFGNFFLKIEFSVVDFPAPVTPVTITSKIIPRLMIFYLTLRAGNFGTYLPPKQATNKSAYSSNRSANCCSYYGDGRPDCCSSCCTCQGVLRDMSGDFLKLL